MDPKESVSKQTDVALEITKQLLLTEFKDKNMVFSPLSLHVVLSLIASGTKGPWSRSVSFFPQVQVHPPPQLPRP
ncbi:hypothetical protein M0R45_017319 [Rubus argutus]|uniref:Serpin domain-containing protein n=1 Tax=Rubus argutus TaxID=59490 RepID=A0AAW1XVM4_RUBAR